MSARRLPLVAVAFLPLLLSAAAGSAATVDFDPDARFEELKSFRFVVYDESSPPRTGVLSNPGMQEEFEGRLGRELVERGLRRAGEEESPDIVVRWWSGVEKTQHVDRVGGYEVFLTSEWSSIYSVISNEYVGKLVFVVDLIDAKSSQLAWRAYLPVKASDPVRTRERLIKQIERALDQYPPSPKERDRRRAERAAAR